MRIYTTVLYTKQRAVKLSNNVNEKHAPSIPIGCHSKHPSVVELLKLLIRYNDPLDYKGENGNNNPAGACCILRPVWPIWPVHRSYTGRCMVYTDRQYQRSLIPNLGILMQL